MIKRMMLIAGARPNFMKLAPLWREMKARPDQFEPIIVHTGQHYDKALSQVFFDDLKLPRPDISLGVGSGSHTQQTAKIMLGLEEALLDRKPDWMVVFGDVNSTIAAALVAAKEHIPIAHVEAGLRSFDREMPEEINRVLTDHISDLLLTSCPDADRNLRRENIDLDRIHFVGNIMIDTLLDFIKAADQSSIVKQLGCEPGEYVLVTLHRPSNVDHKDELTHLVDVLSAVSEHIKVVLPVHPRTKKKLSESHLIDRLTSDKGRFILTDPVGYIDFLKLQKEAKLVLTDSGGIQEETTILGVPCLTMRDNTERPVTITEGSNRLVGTDKRLILAEVARILSDKREYHRKPELWDGKTASRICDILSSTDNSMKNPDGNANVCLETAGSPV